NTCQLFRITFTYSAVLHQGLESAPTEILSRKQN
ncbi:unnamed protein product, partial [Allacma fusca]